MARWNRKHAGRDLRISPSHRERQPYDASVDTDVDLTDVNNTGLLFLRWINVVLSLTENALDEICKKTLNTQCSVHHQDIRTFEFSSNSACYEHHERRPRFTLTSNVELCQDDRATWSES